MDITREPSGDLVILRLRGRLDATWCPPVEAALAAAVRAGDHRLMLDMSEVTYVSSAGLRVLLACHRQLRGIQGLMGVIHPSEAVRTVLELTGLKMLIAGEPTGAAPAQDTGSERTSASATWHTFPLPGGGVRLTAVGDATRLRQGAAGEMGPAIKLGADSAAIGIGALGDSPADALTRCGEFLAAAGVAAFQPGDASSRPDFVLGEGALVPEGRLLLGLVARGSWSALIRFEARAESGTVGLTEFASTLLQQSGSAAAVFVAVAETAGLVGATLRRSPAPPAQAGEERLAFPGIRDWLSFTGERVFRDATTLLVGVVAQPGGPFDDLLRPLGDVAGPRAHIHAAVFPYRPLRQGRIEIQPTVTGLFEGPPVQAILHLLSDPRGLSGAGESQCVRGAVWLAPVLPAP
ncbi:MAG: STAS domain-containing protein [Verrucomicrobia bacterium]|nr:STAS domain-containing protein [Verrucomicrobiota bacterium]